MWAIVKKWFNNYAAEPDVAVLIYLLIGALLVLAFMGQMLAPLLASLVIAYLLDWLSVNLEKLKVPHILSVSFIFMAFIGLLAIALIVLIPALWQQTSNLIQEAPHMIGKGQTLLSELPERYPEYISAAQIDHLLIDFKTNIAKYGQYLLSASFASIPSAIELVVYLVLVPFLVFFFLKDRDILIQFFQRCLPSNRRIVNRVWAEVHEQIGNYVRGKIVELILLAVVTYIAFGLMGLRYAMLLSVLVGLSVIIPYIGAVVVTVPVIAIAFLQWGWHSQFFYLVLVYTILIVLDGNVLVPILFAEAVSLHPVTIIVAVLIFGGIWGFWGIFFAIPLATLVRAVVVAIAESHKTA